MRGNDTLTAMLAILKELDGYFVFTDSDGNEYVVSPRGKVHFHEETKSERQLQLEPAAVPLEHTADALLEDMNRAIDLTREQEQEASFDDIGIVVSEFESESETPSDMPPPRRVRFEPLRGDLPPELQE